MYMLKYICYALIITLTICGVLWYRLIYNLLLVHEDDTPTMWPWLNNTTTCLQKKKILKKEEGKKHVYKHGVDCCVKYTTENFRCLKKVDTKRSSGCKVFKCTNICKSWGKSYVSYYLSIYLRTVQVRCEIKFLWIPFHLLQVG